ncbi:MAG TPA: cytochrome b/b6 domain-containing protein [Polyangiaceae bacterium]|nr:cytochrome b/b6 domain-containing protein [Polyangiaceae bacterium]
MATPKGSHLARFNRTERAVHWVHALAFFVLLGSGLCLYLPSLAEAVGRRGLLKSIHIYTAVAWAIALVAIVVVGDRRSLRRGLREVEYWDADDRRWFRGRKAPQGRLNAGQKLNTIFTAAFSLLFVITGFFLWYGERDTRFRMPNALLIHDWLTYASVSLVMGHLYLSLIYPKTRHSLNGITRGWVREDWARRHHAKWVEALESERPD